MCFTSQPAETIEVSKKDAIVGYRNYDIREGRLWPINYDAKPALKIAEAECRDADFRQEDHGRDRLAPQRRCTCGIYVCASNGGDALEQNRGRVRARVRIWGRIVKHGSEGYRAQFCQVLALYYQGCSWGPDCKDCERLQRQNGPLVAEFYGAEWVKSAEALEVSA